MKKKLTFFPVILLLFFYSCGEKGGKIPDTLEINKENLEFSEYASYQNINLTTNAKWEVNVSDKNWLDCSPATGTGDERVKVAVTENNTKVVRQGSVTVKTEGGITRTVSVIQTCVESTIEIYPQNFAVNPEGENVKVNVFTGVEWNVTIPEIDNWVTIKTRTNNSVEFVVAANTTASGRSSTIVFKTSDGLASANFELTQANDDYVLMATINASEALAAQDPLAQSRSGVHNYIRNVGFDYSENPHCSGGYGGHDDGVHCLAEWDETLKQYVFRMDIHIDPVIDGDRCSSSTTDRQRNEIKSATNNSTWAKIQGNYDEWQMLEWKFKIPKGYQPTSAFCHIHQLKAQDGSYNGSPVITITPRANSNGSNRRIQIIHSVEGGTGQGKGTIQEVPIADFEDEWVQVREEVHYTHNGFYSCLITRISDGKELLTHTDSNIDMWRKGSSYIRSKYGIYRSLNGGDLSKNPVGQSSLLKNESIRLCDFNIYEKNSNPNPGTPHD